MGPWTLLWFACNKGVDTDDTDVVETDDTDDTDVVDTNDTDETDETDTPDGWLRTEGNRILHSDGTPFRGRGANIQDTRGCGACMWQAPAPEEVNRRIDVLVDDWGANFMRLTLESYASNDYGQLHWESVLADPDYVRDIRTIVDHVGTKPGTYVIVALWIDPSHSELGWPTEGTIEAWELLAEEFRDDPHVIYGLINEPQYNFDGALDADVWDAMNRTVRAIRAVEDSAGTPRHLISVQGTGGWARYLDYYVDHPITAGGGENIVYEVHVYDPGSEFDARFVDPSATLPVVIGEFGPADPYMNLDDSELLMQQAEGLGVPYLAWTFHMRCPPNLIVDNSGNGCGVGMDIEPTQWGRALMDRLAVPWGQ